MTVKHSLYTEYMEWRALGFRAITAYLITKMGFIAYLIETEVYND